MKLATRSYMDLRDQGVTGTAAGHRQRAVDALQRQRLARASGELTQRYKHQPNHRRHRLHKEYFS